MALAVSSRVTQTPAFDIWIYTLKLNNNCWYIGRSRQPFQRYKDHENGKGSAWTRLHGGAVLVDVKRKKARDDHHADILETLETLQAMRRYGWRKVRGGWFCASDEEQTRKALLHHGVLDELENQTRTAIR